ncbi:hypothetical protein RLV_0561 (plasmid) [Rhizobium leguminosarum bv. viciae]|jgi:hypothetical protein|nr:hypothetical protein RLV_0561 [Rhizobium leguminosarum bv. viciae]
MSLIHQSPLVSLARKDAFRANPISETLRRLQEAGVSVSPAMNVKPVSTVADKRRDTMKRLDQ